MKKNFPLQDPARDDQRVVEAIKHEVRKYVKRERRKAPPPGFDFWELHCRVGPDAVAATGQPFKEVMAVIDAVALAGATAVYVEILAVPAKWPERAVAVEPGSPEDPPAP